MDDNYIIITINNTEYYIEATRINDLMYIDGKLVNVSNSNITLVNNFDYSTTYPRITCSSMSACVLRSSAQSGYQIVYSNFELPSKFNMNLLSYSQQNTILIALLTIILGIKLLWKK